MSWIITYTGKLVNSFKLTLEDIEIVDVAHSLSLQCRFNGHCNRFYSVAEHCVRMADHVKDETEDDKVAFYALMHDASEAYFGDVPSPIKYAMPKLQWLEGLIWKQIVGKYEIETSEGTDRIIDRADKRMLCTERRALLPGVAEFECCKGVDSYDDDKDTMGWHPQFAEGAFLRMFKYFTGGKE